MRPTLLALAALPALAFCLPRQADAAIVVYTDRTTFQANSTGNSTEDFNSITTDTGFAFSDLTIGDITLSSDGGASVFGEQALIDVAPYVAGGGGVDGTPMINSRGLDFGQSITVSLPGNFSAIGFDYDNYDADLEGLDIVINGNVVATIPATGIVGFIGIVDKMGGTFNQVDFVSVTTERSPDGGTFNGIDNLEWGTAVVPEPSSILLFGMGFVALCGVRRKRKSAA